MRGTRGDFRWSVTGFIILVLIALVGFSQPAHAVFGMADGNSTVNVDPDTQLGVFDWVIDGVNLLPPAGGGINDYRQWFWYRVGATAEASLDTLPHLAPVLSANTAEITYLGPGFQIEVDFTLAGGSLGSGTADIGEQITIRNTGTNNLPISFFQYGDFQLNPPNVGGETVTYPDSHTVREQGAGGAVQETIHTPLATHFEAQPFAITINKLNNGVPDNLSDANVGSPGDVTWAYQWDFNIAPTGSKLISKDMQATIPEPSTTAMVALGMVGVIALAWRRK